MKKFRIGSLRIRFFSTALGQAFVWALREIFYPPFWFYQPEGVLSLMRKQTYEKENRAYFVKNGITAEAFLGKSMDKIVDLIWSSIERIRFGHSLRKD